MKIGELSRLTDISVATIRLYEREGLIDPAERTEGRFRLFADAQLKRLTFIKRTRDLGFTLSEVKELLTLWGPASAAQKSPELVAELIAKIQERQLDLTSLRTALEAGLPGRSGKWDLTEVFPSRQPRLPQDAATPPHVEPLTALE